MKRLGGFTNKGWIDRILGFATINYGYEMGDYLGDLISTGNGGKWKFKSPSINIFEQCGNIEEDLWKYKLLKFGFYGQWFLIYPIAGIALFWFVIVRKQYALPLVLAAYMVLHILNSAAQMRFLVPILPWIAFIAGEFLSALPPVMDPSEHLSENKI